MHRLGRSLRVAIVAVGLVAGPSAAPLPVAQLRAVQLTGSDLLGDGVALVMGPSGFPILPERAVGAAELLYLQPHGFGGSASALFTPEGLYPITGVKSLPQDESQAQGQQILDATVLRQIDRGDVDADHPVVVFGWSQSAEFASRTMEQLHAQGVSPDAVRFVLVGDTDNPNGGLNVLTGTAADATPSNLFPTDIYTSEYDLFADFPRYPLNVVADLNALLGVFYGHATYLSLPPDQVASAIELPTTLADTVTRYYLIPAETLPLLTPLLGTPVIGRPLYDLLEPATRILVNLGYGSIDHGWAPGPADAPASFELFPTDLNWAEVITALAAGAGQGIQAAVADLLDPANYPIVPPLESPALAGIADAAYTLGLSDSPDASGWQLIEGALSRFANFPVSHANLLSPPTDIVNALTATISYDYATLLPLADSVVALLDGDVVDALQNPVVVLEAAAGTMVNLVNLFMF